MQHGFRRFKHFERAEALLPFFWQILTTQIGPRGLDILFLVPPHTYSSRILFYFSFSFTEPSETVHNTQPSKRKCPASSLPPTCLNARWPALIFSLLHAQEAKHIRHLRLSGLHRRGGAHGTPGTDFSKVLPIPTSYPHYCSQWRLRKSGAATESVRQGPNRAAQAHPTACTVCYC